NNSEYISYLSIAAGGVALILVATLLYRFRHKLKWEHGNRLNYDFSSYGGIAVDGKTYSNGEDREFGHFKCNFFTGDKVDLSRMRLHVQNAVKLEGGKLIFYTDQKDLRPVEIEQNALGNMSALMGAVQDKEDEVLGYF